MTTRGLDNCMSLTRKGKQIFLFRVLSLRRSKFLESQLKSLVELSGESKRTAFEFQGWNLVSECLLFIPDLFCRSPCMKAGPSQYYKADMMIHVDMDGKTLAL